MSRLHSSLGGCVEQDGAVVECRYTGNFISGLLGVVVVVWGAGAMAMFAGAVLDGAPMLALGAAPALVGIAAALALIRFRLHRMGRCVIDAEQGTLTRYRGQTQKGRWPLDAIGYEVRLDPFHQGFPLNYWLVARTPEGRGLRLAKGPHAAIEALRDRLVAVGATPS